ncbi:hypothetical protein CY35_07G122700 [Sphagnum magellanicum]|uniref:Uncharacterized protein n=2 Tax=Sphagnum magellanicum TaxID=128215 RepID=A0ACB8HQX5_9BRYO|nr:hypothetical protein CY35_07G122700 [Sphagnum magellanicum]
MTMPTQEATTSVHLLNKKRSTRISAASSDSVQSLKAQVKRLEKQREFLTLWKADVLNGFNLEASYVDVKLQACDGTPVFAHKAVLAARSEEFDAIFQADTNAKEIEIPEMGGEELKAFVSFFYTGSLPINVIAEYMTTFLHVAEKYKVHYLAAVCEDVLVSKLSRDNAITTFDIAKKYCSSDVKEAVLKKALKMGEISTYGEYKLYTQKDPGLLLEFYEQLSERIGPLLAKRRRITPGTGKSDSGDDEVEDDQKGDDDDMRHDGENEFSLGSTVPPNGSSPFGSGGNSGRVVFWHGGPPIPPQHGGTITGDGYDKGGTYVPSHRPAFDNQIVSGPPYGVPPFMPPVYPSSPLLRGGFPGAGTGAVVSMEVGPVVGEDLVQEPKGKRVPSDGQTKLEGKRGQNWTNSEVEALVALRGEMHDEFVRNKQKQGVNTWNKLHIRMQAMCRGFHKTANACKKKYSILYNEYKKDRENLKENGDIEASGTPGTRSKKCAYFDQMDMWHLKRLENKVGLAGGTADSPCTSTEDMEIKEEE